MTHIYNRISKLPNIFIVRQQLFHCTPEKNEDHPTTTKILA